MDFQTHFHLFSLYSKQNNLLKSNDGFKQPVCKQEGEGNGNPLQYSCLENPVDKGAWWAAVHGVAQSRTRLKRFSSSSSWRRDRLPIPVFLGFPCGSAGKESTCNVGDLGSISGKGNNYPFQYSGLENSMDSPWGP